MVKLPLALWAALSAELYSEAHSLHAPRLRHRFITRRRRSTLKNLSADWFVSATGMDTAGNSAKSRFVTELCIRRNRRTP